MQDNKQKKISFGDRATQYAKDVVAGVVPGANLLHLACQRHLDDLARSQDKAYPYVFNPKPKKGWPPSEAICKFAENMVHVKGEWAGTKIRLENWQCFLLGVAFGWLRRADGLRRFREIYWEICRKNSKSTMGAIIGDYMAFLDGEPGAEVLAGATSTEQAMFVFKPAWQMVKKNPDFAGRFNILLGGTEANPGNIYTLENSGCTFRVIIGRPGDGDNPHCAVIDEYHEHTTSDQYDAMKTGMGARRQPLRAIITTAGIDTSGPCYDKHLEAVKILQGTIENDEVFPVIYGIDEEDDWKNFEVWKKANPNMGVSVREDYLRSQLKDAMVIASQTNAILTKNLNRWMSAGSAWMNMAKWSGCARPALTFESCRKLRCWLGLDLASKIDIASLAFIFELPGNEVGFLCRHYLPEDTVELPHNAHYRKWREEGWLTVTDGARTDFLRIEADIEDATKQFSVQELGYDPREANYIIKNVEEWASFKCIEINQGPQLMSEPMKEMEAMVYSNQIVHRDDPVLNWMMANVVKKQGRTGGAVKYYYPTKDRDQNKIDGVVAGIMGLSRKLVKTPEPKYQAFFVG